MLSRDKLAKLIAWGCYDWAAAAYPIIITTFIFSAYFTTQVAADKVTGTYQWAQASALAGLLIAFAGPIFGAIADFGGYHKKWLAFFTSLCVAFTGLLWFAYPSVSYVYTALFCFVVSTIALEVSLVFYNSFLPHIAPKEYLGRISGWSWGAGYLGGIISLSIILFIFINNTPAWINTSTAEQVRICGPIVALWFTCFSLPFFIFIPETPGTGLSVTQAIKKGFHELSHTLKSLKQNKNIFLFLVAHMIYADGLNTLFAFGGIYAAGTFGMNLSQVIMFGITLNISAGIGAILLAWIDDFIGSKPTILISLICLTLFGIPLLFVRDYIYFWGIALFLGIFIGPVQAASRSLMARLSPPDKTTEMFGLYAFSGRITAFLGPWLLGLATYYFDSQRVGMGVVLVFFVAGGVMMVGVRELGEIE